MRGVVFVFVVAACHYAMSSIRLKAASTQVKELKALEGEPFRNRGSSQPPQDKFAGTLDFVDRVAKPMGVDNVFTQSKLSKVSLNELHKLECVIDRHLNAEKPPYSMFKQDDLDKAKKLRSYGSDPVIKDVAEFRLFPDDLDGLTLDSVAHMDSGDSDEKEGEEIDERIGSPCLHVAIMQDVFHRILGKVEWIDKRCQSGDAMMELADELFQCFGVEEASLHNKSSIQCGAGKEVQLSLLRTLTRGQTWYQKFEYEPAGWDSEGLEFVLKLQTALHGVLFDELRGVWEHCGKPMVFETHNRSSAAELSDRISSLFSEHDRLLKSQNSSLAEEYTPGTIGYFANWLARNHCEDAQEVLGSTVVFPCHAYRNSDLRDLDAEIWADVNSFAGAMVKMYNVSMSSPSLSSTTASSKSAQSLEHADFFKEN